MGIIELLRQPWPWYVAGPIIGLTVPILLLLGNKAFGISSNLRHMCAMVPNRVSFFNYNWWREGGENLAFAMGIILSGFVGGVLLASPEPLHVAASTQASLGQLGVEGPSEFANGFAPAALFSMQALLSFRGLAILLGGGFLVGFGTRYAGGCTSGHAISGLSNLQLPSLVAVIGFFIGGLVMTHWLLPFLLGGA